MSAVTLHREIDALGGAGSDQWEIGYNAGIGDALAVLEKRGFSEFGDPIEALCVAVEAVLADLGQPGADGWTDGYAHTTDIDRLQQAIATARGAA